MLQMYQHANFVIYVMSVTNFHITMQRGDQETWTDQRGDQETWTDAGVGASTSVLSEWISSLFSICCFLLILYAIFATIRHNYKRAQEGKSMQCLNCCCAWVECCCQDADATNVAQNAGGATQEATENNQSDVFAGSVENSMFQSVRLPAVLHDTTLADMRSV